MYTIFTDTFKILSKKFFFFLVLLYENVSTSQDWKPLDCTIGPPHRFIFLPSVFSLHSAEGFLKSFVQQTAYKIKPPKCLSYGCRMERPPPPNLPMNLSRPCGQRHISDVWRKCEETVWQKLEFPRFKVISSHLNHADVMFWNRRQYPVFNRDCCLSVCCPSISSSQHVTKIYTFSQLPARKLLRKCRWLPSCTERLEGKTSKQEYDKWSVQRNVKIKQLVMDERQACGG